MGGEPLLHHYLEKIIRCCAEVFPDNQIDICTNGSLLGKKPPEFWKICSNYNVTLQVTKYPVNIDYALAEKKAREYNVRYVYWAGGDTVKTLYHEPIDLSGSQDPVLSFMNCSRAVNCSMLSEGKLYPCPLAPCIHIFNSKFNTNIPLTENDGINIYDVGSGDELLERLSRPMQICRFCDIEHYTSGISWHRTTQSIEEWIYKE